jgi:hypothetical protein
MDRVGRLREKNKMYARKIKQAAQTTQKQTKLFTLWRIFTLTYTELTCWPVPFRLTEVLDHGKNPEQKSFGSI